VPDWPVPENVKALTTQRGGGVSKSPWDSMNLGWAESCGDDPSDINHNRAALRETLQLKSEPIWMQQVHGVDCFVLESNDAVSIPCADAATTQCEGRAIAVLTADCLPVFLSSEAGDEVAVIHAGWRGLLAGVIQNTVKKMHASPENIVACFGPAIGPDAFEIGAEVRDAFIKKTCFSAKSFKPVKEHKYLADIYRLARQALADAGVDSVFGGEQCTYHQEQHYFSYRRDGVTGRMASLIWIEPR